MALLYRLNLIYYNVFLNCLALHLLQLRYLVVAEHDEVHFLHRAVEGLAVILRRPAFTQLMFLIIDFDRSLHA